MDFPHRKPEDWTLLLKFVHPSNRDQHDSLNERNVEALLPWFHDMGMTWMMKPCDDLCSQMFDPKRVNAPVSGCTSFADADRAWVNEIIRCVGMIEMAAQYGLCKTLKSSLRAFSVALRLNPGILAWPDFRDAIEPVLQMDPLLDAQNEDCQMTP